MRHECIECGKPIWVEGVDYYDQIDEGATCNACMNKEHRRDTITIGLALLVIATILPFLFLG